MIPDADDTRTRQGLYRLLGATLRPPALEGLMVWPGAAEFLNTRDLDRFSYSREWRAFAEQVVGGVFLDELETDYVRLFGVGMSGTPATPTESFYRIPKRDGGIGDFVAQLQREYRGMGLVFVGSSEAPDHIATEMDVMSCLCGREADALDSGDSLAALEALGAQRGFLRSHLNVWVPIFATRARAADPHPFYESVVDLLHSFVVDDTHLISALAARLEDAWA